MRLPARPVGGHHHAARQLVGDVRAQIAPHQMQAQVESGGEPGAGEDIAVVHVQHRLVDLHLRVPLGQLGGVQPMGGRAASVEQPRLGEREGTGTEGDHAGTRVMGAPQGRDQPLRQRPAFVDTGVGHRGHDDRVRVRQVVESVAGPQGQPVALRTLPRPRSRPAEPQVVPGIGQIRLRLAEHRAGDAQFVQIPRRDPDLLGHDHGDRTSTHAPKRMAGIWWTPSPLSLFPIFTPCERGRT